MSMMPKSRSTTNTAETTILSVRTPRTGRPRIDRVTTSSVIAVKDQTLPGSHFQNPGRSDRIANAPRCAAGAGTIQYAHNSSRETCCGRQQKVNIVQGLS